MVLFQQLHYYDLPGVVSRLSSGSGWLSAWRASRVTGASDAWLVDYNAALASVCFMLFLGFADDVLDVPWRVKLALPTLAALPLLVAYSGGTSVVVPRPGRWALGAIGEALGRGLAAASEALAGAKTTLPPSLASSPILAALASFVAPSGSPLASLAAWLRDLPPAVDVGALYHLYLLALVVFCTNSINILAGVNGLEVGQTMVVSGAVLLHNALELASPRARADPAFRDGHLFSALLVTPLLFVSGALLRYNWFPARVFVGDTYTYFAGMTVAVAGILGHFSETLLLFLVPQVLNFLYSIPQLFHLVPCPRHRLPTYDPKTGLLHATPNWNLVNATLQILGPTTEKQLCIRLLLFQALCCAGGFYARKALAGVYKE